MAFIRVVIEENSTPTLLNLDKVETIRLVDGKTVVYYENPDKTGANWEHDLKTPFDKVEERLVEAGLLTPKTK